MITDICRDPGVRAAEPPPGAIAYLDYPGILTLAGLDQVMLFQRRQVPHGPLWHLTGLDIIECSLGAATWRLPITGWLRSPAGVIPGGVLAFAADGALGCAIQTALPPRRVVATADLTVNFVQPPAENADAVLVHARLLSLGRHQALSQASIDDSDGRHLAHATTRCMLIDIPAGLPDPPEVPIPEPDHPRPHLFERRPIGQPLPQAMWDATDGIDILKAWQEERLPRSPLSNLLGAHLRHIEPGAVGFEIGADRWFSNLAGTMYGGVVALMADYAIHGAVQSTAEAGTSWATLDLNVRYLRPIMPDGRPVAVQARVVHRGRRLGLATAEVMTADDKLAAVANASVMLLPGRPWTHPVDLVDEELRDGHQPSVPAPDAASRPRPADGSEAVRDDSPSRQ